MIFVLRYHSNGPQISTREDHWLVQMSNKCQACWEPRAAHCGEPAAAACALTAKGHIAPRHLHQLENQAERTARVSVALGPSRKGREILQSPEELSEPKQGGGYPETRGTMLCRLCQKQVSCQEIRTNQNSNSTILKRYTILTPALKASAQ